MTKTTLSRILLAATATVALLTATQAYAQSSCEAIKSYQANLDNVIKHPGSYLIENGHVNYDRGANIRYAQQKLFESKELCNSEKIAQAQRELDLAKTSTPKIAAQDAELKRLHEETFATSEQSKKEHAERAREQAKVDQEHVASAAESQKDLDAALTQARVAKAEHDSLIQKQDELRRLQAEEKGFSHVEAAQSQADLDAELAVVRQAKAERDKVKATIAQKQNEIAELQQEARATHHWWQLQCNKGCNQELLGEFAAIDYILECKTVDASPASVYEEKKKYGANPSIRTVAPDKVTVKYGEEQPHRSILGLWKAGSNTYYRTQEACLTDLSNYYAGKAKEKADDDAMLKKYR
jgi:hypothetical protein